MQQEESIPMTSTAGALQQTQKLKKANPFYLKFLGYFLLVLLVPLVTIVYGYYYAETVVAREIENASESALYQIFNSLEMTVQEMRDTSVAILYNDTCQSYAYTYMNEPERAPYKVIELKKYLSLSAVDKYFDLFVYYPEEGRIVSGFNSSVDVNTYYTSYYKANGVQWLDFVDVIENTSTRASFFTLSNSELFFGVSMQQSVLRGAQLDYSVAVILQPDYLDDMLQATFAEANSGVILIFDQDKNLVVSSNQTDITFTLDEYDGTSSSYETEIDGEVYIMQVQPSEVIDGYYACAIPKAYFWRRLWDLRITCGVAAVLCFIISLVVSYLLSSRAYSPIHSMIQRVRSVVEPAERESATDEFEFIANVVETSAKEKAALTNKLRVQVDSEKQRFLLYLMQNAAAGENMGMEELFAQKQIELRSPYFATALIYVESGVGDETSAALSATDVKLLPVAFRNVYTELFENGHLIYLIFLESNQYLLLVNGASQESLQQEWEEQLLLGKTLMERMFHLSFTVAYSEPQEDITGLKVCYQQAAYAKRYRFVKGRGQAIAYRDVAQTTFDYITTSDSKTAQAVQAYLQNPNDTRTAAQVLQEILNLQNITPTSSMETIDCCRFDVVNALNQVMCMNHFSDTERAQQLLACETFRTFRQNAEDCIAALRKDTKLQSEQSKLSKAVKDYIEQHYQDANLNVSALGEAMNLSPAYLSRLFRAEYQVSALDHLYFVRVAAAKELLRSSTRTVSEIAQETGFLSSNVFIKTFKKIEGVTPGAYRSVYQNQ